jgi:hypothetical protein
MLKPSGGMLKKLFGGVAGGMTLKKKPPGAPVPPVKSKGLMGKMMAKRQGPIGKAVGRTMEE